MNLRPYQKEDMEKIQYEFFNQGITCQGGMWPCGGGKGSLAANLPSALGLLPGESLFFVAHRHELIDQAVNKFRFYNPYLTVGVERASDRALPDSDVVVGSVQSLNANRLKKFDPDRFRVICVDEVHHAFSSAMYQRVLEYFQVHRSRDTLSRQKLLLGISATWRRGDNVGAEHLFDKIVFHRTIRDLMNQGLNVGGEWCPYLAPIRGHRELSEIHLERVRISKGDFDNGELARAVNTPERNNAIVDAYFQHGEGFPAIAFTVNVQHAVDLAKAFCDRGLFFQAISGETPRDERSDIFSGYAQGIVQGLCSCSVLTEGTDLPYATVGLMARPTLSTLLYTQCFGRISRPFPAPEERMAALCGGTTLPWVKPHGIWIDFTDSSTKHSLVQVPTLFGLRPEFQFKGKDVEETLKLIDDAKAKDPSLDTTQLRSLDDLTRTSVAFSTTETLREATEIRKWSSYFWQQESPDQYALVIRGTNSVYRVRRQGDATFCIYHFLLGSGRLMYTETTLRKAVAKAEELLAPKEKKLLRLDAPWRRESPTESQCVAIWSKDSDTRRGFRTGREFFLHASKQWESGDMAYSRGAMADMIGVFAVANRIYGIRAGSQRKGNFIAKGIEGVKKKFA